MQKIGNFVQKQNVVGKFIFGLDHRTSNNLKIAMAVHKQCLKLYACNVLHLQKLHHLTYSIQKEMNLIFMFIKGF